MLFSRSAEYAIRALAHLCRSPSENSLLSRDIAEAVDLPSDFLSKILRTLTEEGILVSQRGRTGGFRLVRDPAQITLLEIVEPFDHLDTSRNCLLGGEHCSDETACPLHDSWKGIMDQLLALLQNTSLADVARLDTPSGFPRRFTHDLHSNSRTDIKNKRPAESERKK